EPAITGAAALVGYHKAHARRAYGRMTSRRRDLAITLLAALKAQGALTQEEVRGTVLHRNVPAARVRAALEELEEAGLVGRAGRKPDGAGRPGTEWRAL